MSVPTFDYIVVGAGSAGAVLAARLTENGHDRVLLLEAGRNDHNIWIHVPLGVGKLLHDGRYAWKFETEPQPAMKGQRIYWPRGKVLGGSSALNGMAYVWGDPSQYDRWRDDGCAGWGFADVKQYFKRLESNPYANGHDRGHDGPVHITDRKVRDPDPLSDAFVQACRQSGITETADYNAQSYEGVRYLEQTAHNGWRVTTAGAYLRSARRRPNLAIETNAVATRVLFDGTLATGIEYTQGSETRVAHATREVLLAAGAIQSPHLLELSGVGDAERLRGLGIPVVAHVPQVGENVIDHIQVRCTYETTLPITINDLQRSAWIRMRAGVRYLLTRKGLLAGTASTAHAITRTSPQLDAPDVMIRVYHVSGKDRYARSKAEGIDPYPGFSMGGFRLHPKSRGSIHSRSRDPLEPPAIQPNYLQHPDDRDTAVALLRLVRRIASQPAIAPLIVAERRPGPAVEDADALLDYIRETGQTAWHTVGSCRMGRPGEGVVDSRLRVHSVRALRVVDVSVMPTIASSNTNAPAMMIGEKALDLIRGDDAA